MELLDLFRREAVGAAEEHQIGGLELIGKGIAVFREEWERAGGEGEPRFVARVDFSLGEDLVAESRENLRTYYAFVGPYVDAVVEAAPRTPDAIRMAIDGYAALGIVQSVLVHSQARRYDSKPSVGVPARSRLRAGRFALPDVGPAAADLGGRSRVPGVAEEHPGRWPPPGQARRPAFRTTTVAIAPGGHTAQCS